MTEYNLNFMHPKYGTTLNVDIDGSFTVEEMINNLLLSGFINKNKGGYDFELMGQALDRQITFNEIQELYDGAVIRIVAHKETNIAPKNPSEQLLSLHIKHPLESLVLDLEVAPKMPLSAIIQQANDKNFIQAEDTILHLQKGGKLLDLNGDALANKLSSGDYLELIQAEQNQEDPIGTAVEQVSTKLQQLETQLQAELTKIKDALPAANMIPIDTTRAVNPTMESYESIDTIVQRLRKDSKQAALKPIRPLSPFLLGFLSLLVLLLVVAAVILATQML